MTQHHCSELPFYHGLMFRESERRMRAVVALTAVMMIAEVIGGVWLGSMALLADGFHMGTHVGALGISAFAYAYARRYAHDPRYSFGTGKVGDLAGFTSAIFLGIIALYVILEAVARFWHPVTIQYEEAIAIAALGFIVNITSAAILHQPHVHGYEHSHAHHGDGHAEHHGHAYDNNFRSAYIHVIADALTSLLAIIALGCAWYFHWNWLDPLAGIVGAFVIISWAWSLIRDTSSVLLDRAPPPEAGERIRKILADNEAQITDLHIWRVGPEAYAAILAVTPKNAITPATVREWLKPLALSHLTVEINQSP